jgi:hypothetical protein
MHAQDLTVQDTDTELTQRRCEAAEGEAQWEAERAGPVP